MRKFRKLEALPGGSFVSLSGQRKIKKLCCQKYRKKNYKEKL
jgi:hypothetical protein